jgi:hypothetical protein
MKKVILKIINSCLKQAYDLEKEMKEIDKARIKTNKEMVKYLK